MKKLLLAFIFCLGLVFNTQALNADTIKNFAITLDVKEDGMIHVTQKIKMDFASQRHGIYANIPQNYTMKIDGKNKKYYFPVKNIKVKEHNYETTFETDGVTIKIGSADYYVEGIVDYQYEYDIITRDLGLDGMQMLYFNLVGAKRENAIEKVNFKINMPKSFDGKPYFYPPVNSKEKVKYEVVGNVIKGSFSDQMGYGDALTIKLDLPNDYFAFPDLSAHQSKMTIVFGLMSGLIIALFFVFGKDRQLIKSVQFKAPHGMSSAQVGYVVDGAIQNRDITSLFVYWAAKGYLTIKEETSGKFEFIKNTEIGEAEINIEKAIFNALFDGGDTVKSDDIPEDYFTVITGLNSDYKEYFKHKKTPIFERKSKILQFLTFMIVVIVLSTNMYLNVSSYFAGGLLGFVAFGVTFILSIVLGLFMITSLTNRKAKKKSTNFGLTIAGSIAIVVYSAIYLLVANLVGSDLLYQAIMVGLGIVSFVFVAFMDKRTKQGNDWLGEILGLKEFIQYAKKDRIEALVEKNPTYFYDVLPYAYVLNVSDKWIKKFEGIEMEQPSWYQSATPLTNYVFISNLNHSLNSINTATLPKVEAGEGGFSSGGGGFGGGGGGSW